jgi:soluble lytic murein transglycosylase-like protein
MRSVAIGVAIALFAAAAADAQVQLTVQRNGTKVISNFSVLGVHGSDWSWLAKQRNRASRFDNMIDRWAIEYGVDPILVRAVIQVESDFNPNCVSNKGARGLMQLMPETARRYGVKQIHDPNDNIRGGVRYLADLLTRYSSDLPRVLAAYNAGEGAVAKYSGIPPYKETMMYVKRALTVYYGQPYGGGLMIAGARSGGPKLKGGFTSRLTPVVSAMLPGMRYLGSIGR